MSIGKLITFEGLDGVGKTTQCKNAAQYLRTCGRDVLETRSLGGTEFGTKMRETLLYGNVTDTKTQAYISLAVMREHFHNIIRPALSAGKWIVCDRYYDSTMAYQSGGNGADPDWLMGELRIAMENSRPDRTFFFDAPVNREDRYAKGADNFESKDNAFYLRVYATYVKRNDLEPERIKVLEWMPMHLVSDAVERDLLKLISS